MIMDDNKRTLKDLYNNGVIKMLCQKGLVSITSLSYLNYYNTFSEYRAGGKTFRDSVSLTSVDYKVHEDTIKRAVRIVKNQMGE